ncbi:MAG: alpha-amylase family glycosyl hydrolase [Caldilineaceae bacterium]
MPTDRWLTPAALNDFTGGTLQGICTKLDYLNELGITAIWLSPIFTAVSYHAYDTVDYFSAIDPRFGTEADLRALVAAAHDLGIRVILDFVANHTGITFAPFVAAQAATDSPHREWFSFDDAYPHGYRTFFDVAEMPQLNAGTPTVPVSL